MTSRILLLCVLLSINFVSISAKYCYGHFDYNSCSYDQVCCNNNCVYGSDCSGRFCSFDSDCSLSQVCCSNNCSYDCNTVGVVIGSIVGVVLFILFISLITYCCIRRRRRLSGQPVLGQRIISTQTTTTTAGAVLNYPQQGPYQGQQAYGYQQGYLPPPPPPQYANYGATNPLPGPWQSGSAKPPPYEETPTVAAAGYGNTNQQNNYPGASAPPLQK